MVIGTSSPNGDLTTNQLKLTFFWLEINLSPGVNEIDYNITETA